MNERQSQGAIIALGGANLRCSLDFGSLGLIPKSALDDSRGGIGFALLRFPRF